MPHFGERRILLRSERIVRSAFFPEGGGDPFQKKLRRLGHGENHGFLMLAPEPGQLPLGVVPGALLQPLYARIKAHAAVKIRLKLLIAYRLNSRL